MLKNLNGLPLIVNYNLPNVYDDTKSLYEYVQGMEEKINEIVDYLNDEVDEGKQYTDEQVKIVNDRLTEEVANLYAYADTLNINLTELINATEEQLTIRLTKYVDDEIVKVNTSISNLDFNTSLKISNLKLELTTLLNQEISQLKEYIDSAVIDIKVVDVITGEIVTIQQALQSLADLHKEEALTAEEYDLLGLTAEAYDNQQITANDYDFRGKTILG